MLGIANAAIDVSDGLLGDLGHICERSGCAAAVRLVQLPHLPKGESYNADLRRLALECQLAGGDDYELVFTARPEQHLAIGKIAALLELPLWCIGEMVDGEAGAVTVFDPDDKAVDFSTRATIILNKPPSLKFLFAHPAHFFALGCGSGLSQWAPGTVGTAFAWVSYLLFRPYFQELPLLALLGVAYLAGIWFIDVTGRDHRRPRSRQHRLGRDRALLADPAADAGHLLLAAGRLHAVPLLRHHQAATARYFDQHVKNGFGVMADDLVAAGYTLLCLALLKRILT